ncbi:uncharacterized protein BDR25DRAFT_353819 [Lindgomyces ingoldianus]|uniref:Uncharacterized protein n=1 Tax=Lindgomyces ingoldianus TaxID=673940 RepID=A0ACB6R0P4_9PLEO|nr:uncharacterized protein BDR25DRAFT_353819 [Lindgomyces ingoldianus]KAF2472077.1 hypothetical protein BDR25DRAFT_353819 [Lindgomyces ingoldianus]
MGIVVGKRRVAISRSVVEEARVMLKIANKSSFAFYGQGRLTGSRIRVLVIDSQMKTMYVLPPSSAAYATPFCKIGQHWRQHELYVNLHATRKFRSCFLDFIVVFCALLLCSNSFSPNPRPEKGPPSPALGTGPRDRGLIAEEYIEAGLLIEGGDGGSQFAANLSDNIPNNEVSKPFDKLPVQTEAGRRAHATVRNNLLCIEPLRITIPFWQCWHLEGPNLEEEVDEVNEYICVMDISQVPNVVRNLYLLGYSLHGAPLSTKLLSLRSHSLLEESLHGAILSTELLSPRIFSPQSSSLLEESLHGASRSSAIYYYYYFHRLSYWKSNFVEDLINVSNGHHATPSVSEAILSLSLAHSCSGLAQGCSASLKVLEIGPSRFPRLISQSLHPRDLALLLTRSSPGESKLCYALTVVTHELDASVAARRQRGTQKRGPYTSENVFHLKAFLPNRVVKDR